MLQAMAVHWVHCSSALSVSPGYTHGVPFFIFLIPVHRMTLGGVVVESAVGTNSFDHQMLVFRDLCIFLLSSIVGLP